MIKRFFASFFWPALTALLAAGWLATLFFTAARPSASDQRCAAVCGALNVTYEVEGLPLLMDNGRNVFRKGIFSQEAVLTEIKRVPVSGALGDNKNSAAVLLEQNHGGAGVYYYIAAVLPDGHGSVRGTNALLLGDRVQIQDITVEDGIIWITLFKKAPDAGLSDPPSVPATVQVYCDDGRLYFVSENPLH